MAATIETGTVIRPGQRFGEVVGDNYKLNGDLVEPTAYSILHRATDLETGESLVFKEFWEPFDDIPTAQRIDLEVATHMTLTENPHVIPMHDTRVLGLPDNDRRGIMLKLATGGSLDRILTKSGADIDTAISAARSMVPAIEAVHDIGLVHGDIKPGNILTDVEQSRWWLTDFGVVRVLGSLDEAMEGIGILPSATSRTVSESLLPTSTVQGTLGFIAPEWCDPETSITGAIDVYGLGATLYKAITGQLPYDEPKQLREHREHIVAIYNGTMTPRPLRSLNPAASVALEALVMSCVEPSPTNRGTLQEVGSELSLM